MTPAETILEQLSAWRPPSAGPHVLRVPLALGAAVFTADRVDELGGRFTAIGVQTGEPRDCSAAQLTERAIKTAARVTGLLEPLTVYEVDAGRSVALLRSATPAERGPELFYYELTLTGTHAAELMRYKAPKGGGRRDRVSFALTHEAASKVVDDIASA